MEMDYQWLVFDVDNTLLDFTRSARIALTETLQFIGEDPGDHHFDAYHQINLECWADLEAGRISAEELKTRRFSSLLEHLGKEGDPGKLNSFYFEVLKNATYPIEGAIETVKALYRQGFKMAVATNGLAEVQRPRLERAGIDHFFEEIIVSEEIGYFKPNPGFFHTAVERLRAKRSDRLLMIGDNLVSDIEAAQKAGWDACWFNPRREEHSLPQKPDFVINHLSQLQEILT